VEQNELLSYVWLQFSRSSELCLNKGMKHILILLVTTCWSYAHAENTGTVKLDNQDINLSCETSDRLMSSQSLERTLSSTSTFCPTTQYPTPPTPPIQLLTVLNCSYNNEAHSVFMINETTDKRMRSSDYNNNVLMKRLPWNQEKKQENI